MSTWSVVAWTAVAAHAAVAALLWRHWMRDWLPWFLGFLVFQVPSTTLFNLEQRYRWHAWRYVAAVQVILLLAISIEACARIIYTVHPTAFRTWRFLFGAGIAGMLLPGALFIPPYLNFPPWIFRGRLWVCVFGIALCVGAMLGAWRWRPPQRMRPIFYAHATLLALYLACIVWAMSRPRGSMIDWQVYDAVAQGARTLCLVGWAWTFRSGLTAKASLQAAL